jgi:hypothetical protein
MTFSRKLKKAALWRDHGRKELAAKRLADYQAEMPSQSK